MTPTNTQAQMKVVADTAFAKDMKSSVAGTVTTTLTKHIGAEATTLNYTTTTKVSTFMLGLIGMDTIDVTTLSVADATIRNSEIVFVLDSTGSMEANGRMTNLKSSVDAVLASLVDTDGNNTGGTKVSIIPFDLNVKVAPGTSYTYIDYGKASSYQWCRTLDWGMCDTVRQVDMQICTDGSDADVMSCIGKIKRYTKQWTSGTSYYYDSYMKSYYLKNGKYRISTYRLQRRLYQVPQASTQQCYDDETGHHCYMTDSYYWAWQTIIDTGTIANKTDLSTYNSAVAGFKTLSNTELYYQPDTGSGFGAEVSKFSRWTDSGHKYTQYLPPVPDQKTLWTGCVTDRTQPYDVQDDAAVATTPATLYPAVNCQNGTLQKVSGLSTDIAAARASVAAMQPSGNTNITIGIQWGLEAMTGNAPLTGAAAYSDVKFTKYMIIVTDGTNTQNRFTYDVTEINKRTAKACQAAKDRGITVFVVRVIEGDTALLKTCATKPSYFYDLSSADQLSTTMINIFSSMRKIKLAK